MGNVKTGRTIALTGIVGLAISLAAGVSSAAVPEAAIELTREAFADSPDTLASFEAELSTDVDKALADVWKSRNPPIYRTYFGHLAGRRFYTASDAFYDGLRNVPLIFQVGAPPVSPAHLAQAETFFGALLAQTPEDAVAHNGLGYIRLERGDYEGSEAAFTEALSRDRQLVEARNGRALSLLARPNGGAEGVEHLRQAWSANTDYGNALYGLAVGQIVTRGRDIGTEFEKLVDRFPEHRDGWYKLGAYHEADFMVESEADHGKAADAYRRQTEANPGHPKAWFRLGRALNRSGRSEETIQTLQRVTATHPEHRHAYLPYFFKACLRQGDGKRAWSAAREYVTGLDAHTRSIYENILTISNPEETSDLTGLDGAARTDYVKRFWQKRDPTPVTDENERRVEHYFRVHNALELYPSDTGLWDRRGDIYLRYGDPAHISRWNNIRVEGTTTTLAAKDRLLQSLPMAAQQEIAEAIGDAAHEASLGGYLPRSGQRGFTPGGGREQMLDAVVGFPLYPVPRGQFWEYWLYPDVAAGLEVTFMTSVPDGPMDYPPPPEGRGRGNDAVWEAQHPEKILAETIAVESEVYRSERPTIAVTLDHADFRGTGTRARLEMYFGYSHRNLTAVHEDTGYVVRGIALFDTTWTTRYRRTDTLTFVKRGEGAEIGISEFPVNLPGGSYIVGAQFEDPASTAIGSAYLEVEIDDYPAGAFGLSDIEWASVIREPEAAGGRLTVFPNPTRQYTDKSPVKMHYQIYGLSGGTDQRCRYTVDVRIDPRDEAAPFDARVLRSAGKVVREEEDDDGMSIRTEASSDRPDQEEYLELKVLGRSEGHYDVTVSVTDLETNQSLTKRSAFEIVRR
jgi:GWxTD domain-containing protein